MAYYLCAWWISSIISTKVIDMLGACILGATALIILWPLVNATVISLPDEDIAPDLIKVSSLDYILIRCDDVLIFVKKKK